MLNKIYFVKNKSGNFDKFKEFKSMIEKETGKYIKVLTSDGGGEYASKSFIELYMKQGITRQFTTRYNPQKNGVDERKI